MNTRTHTPIHTHRDTLKSFNIRSILLIARKLFQRTLHFGREKIQEAFPYPNKNKEKKKTAEKGKASHQEESPSIIHTRKKARQVFLCTSGELLKKRRTGKRRKEKSKKNQAYFLCHRQESSSTTTRRTTTVQTIVARFSGYQA